MLPHGKISVKWQGMDILSNFYLDFYLCSAYTQDSRNLYKNLCIPLIYLPLFKKYSLHNHKNSTSNYIDWTLKIFYFTHIYYI